MKIKLTKEELEDYVKRKTEEDMALFEEEAGELPEDLRKSFADIFSRENEYLVNAMLKRLSESYESLVGDLDKILKPMESYNNLVNKLHSLNTEDNTPDEAPEIDKENEDKNLPVVNVSYPERYKTSNTRAEYKMFWDKERSIVDFTGDGMDVNRSENSDIALGHFKVAFRNEEDAIFIQKHRQEAGAILSAIHGTIYDACEKLYLDSDGLNFNFHTQHRPTIILNEIYSYFTQDRNSKLCDAGEATKELFTKIIDILRFTEITTEHYSPQKNQSSKVVQKSYFFPAESITALVNGKRSTTAYAINTIPPFVYQSILHKQYMFVNMTLFPKSLNPPKKKTLRGMDSITLQRGLRGLLNTINRKENPVMELTMGKIRDRYIPDGRNKRPARILPMIEKELDILKEQGVFYDYRTIPEYKKGERISDDVKFEIRFLEEKEEKEIMEKKKHLKDVKDEAHATEQGRMEAHKKT